MTVMAIGSIGGPEIQSWWGGQAGAWVGSIGGTVVGCCGGAIGILVGMGRGRRFVLTLMAAMVVSGVVAAVAGLYAVLSGQPYAVWYPLLLGGCLTTGITIGVYPAARRRYQDIELRRIHAADSR
jgi:hypothetical protein